MASDDWTPCLFRLFGVQEDTASLRDLPPEVLKRRTFDALHQLSMHRSRQQPMILVAENLHWIDPSSEEYLMALVERLPGTAILLLTTYRPGYQPRWMDKSYATQVALRPLTPAESQQVVHTLLRTAPQADAHLPAILAKANGNPFFLEELVRAAAQGIP
jgi:predicted ATPase